MGIWSGTMDGTDVNGVDRSPSQRFLASADDFGKVNLFNYPCLNPKGSPHNAYTGHSSHVTSVRWTSVYPTGRKGAFLKPRTDDFLISIGGEDKCVFQWRHSDPDGKERSSNVDEAASPSVPETMVDDIIDTPSGGDEFMAVKPWLGAIVAPSAWTAKDPQKAPPFFAALGEYANQLRSFQEDVGTITKEDALKERYQDLQQVADNVLQRIHDSGVVDPSQPSDELELDWVHGYRGFDTRSNIFYVNTPNNGRLVVYHAAALGIVLNPQTKEQKYFRGHKDDILAMTIFDSKDQVLVATGQQALANIYVWEVPSMQTLAVLPTKQKTVQHLAFSTDGRLLISISEDLQIVVSDWKTQSIVASVKSDAKVHSISIVGGEGGVNPVLQFFTAGDKLLRLWTLQGRNPTSAKYVTSTLGGTKIQPFLCVVEISKKFYVGCEDGSIYVIPMEDKAKGVKSRFTHSEEGKDPKDKGKGNAVTAMHVCYHADKLLLLTGAKDGTIVVWDASEVNIADKPTKLHTFAIGAVGLDDITAKQIQSIYALRRPGSILQLLVGTRGCDLLEVQVDIVAKSARLLSGTQELMRGILARGHCNDELWGVDTHPFLPEFVTVGDDKTLRFYNLHSHETLLVLPLGHISRAVAYNSTGDLLALGFGGRVGRGKESGGGIVRIYSANWKGEAANVKKVAERQDAKQWISDVKFSTDGRTVVASAHDCKVYIYDLAPKGEGYELKLRANFSKHNSVVTHIDLSHDGRYMQSTCAAYELLFSDVRAGRQITSSSELKDVKWSTITCPLGWGVQGIWAAGADGSDINAVSRSHTGHLLATSDDFGQVNIFRYPVCEKTSKPLSYSGHSSHVMCVRWTCGDEFLLSTGGNDKTVFQWKHRIEEGGGGMGASIGVSGKKKVRIDSGYESDTDKSIVSVSDIVHDLDDFAGAPGGGDESGAVK
ncbi:hypothetical protein EON65_22800, partial [archaeon]